MSGTDLDAHGQPINRLYCRKRRHDRSLDELIGLAKGMAADGIINQAEAIFLQKWLEKNNEITSAPLVETIYNRVCAMLCDEVLDLEESQELLGLLTGFTGPLAMEKQLENMTATLPLDEPPPELFFNDKLYCFTGKFLSATRRECEELTATLGGICKTSVSGKLDYLVIGFIGSEDWAHTSYGRKIEKALELKNQGTEIHIVSEDHWTQYTMADN